MPCARARAARWCRPAARPHRARSCGSPRRCTGRFRAARSDRRASRRPRSAAPAMEAQRPPVVAEALPLPDRVRRRGGGERRDCRPPLEPGEVARDDAVDLRLLEHDLRDEDRVRVARPPSRGDRARSRRTTPEGRPPRRGAYWRRIRQLCEHVFVWEDATILHADLDPFFASVEQRDDPRLRGRPVIVGGGVVLAASYEAKAFGVHSAMEGRQARRLCPHAAVVSPRMEAYVEASKAVFEVFEDTTPLVEGISIDEAFLDVAVFGGSPAGRPRSRSGCADESASRSACRSRWAWRGRSSWRRWRARSRSPTACSSSRRGASSRSSIRCRSSACGVSGPSPRAGCTTSGSARSARSPGSPKGCSSRYSAAPGRHLHALAHNHDPRRVRVGPRRGSIGSQHALGRGRKSPAFIDATLVAIVDRLARRLRTARRVCRTVTLRCASTTSRARRGRTRSRRRPPRPARFSRPRGVCSPQPCRCTTRTAARSSG